MLVFVVILRKGNTIIKNSFFGLTVCLATNSLPMRVRLSVKLMVFITSTGEVHSVRQTVVYRKIMQRETCHLC